MCMHGHVCFFSHSLSVLFSHPSSPYPGQAPGCGVWVVETASSRGWLCSLLCVPLIRVSLSKAPGLQVASLSWCPACGVMSGQSSNLPSPACSSLHLSFCACTWAATAGWWARAAMALWLLSQWQNRAFFHWISQGRTAHLAAAPVHMSWSVVQLIHYFLVCKRKKLLLSARHTSLSWVTHSLFYSQDCSPQSLHALLHLLPRWC